MSIKGDEASAEPGADRTTGAVFPADPVANASPPEHLTDGGIGCWCGPYRDPLDPEVIIHRRPVPA